MSVSQKCSLKKILPLTAILLVLFSFFYFHLYRYCSFESLHRHRKLLLQWKDAHYLVTVCTYIALYILSIAAFLPCNIFFCLVGGFLFNLFPGMLYILFSATLGSTLSFLAVRMTLADWIKQKAGPWLTTLEQGFKENAFNYLLSLRLFPLFPFFVVNTLAGLLGTKLLTFISATLIGILPAVLIYAAVGHSLETLFDAQELPNFTIIFQLRFLLPLLGLALLTTLPVIYKRGSIKHKRT